MRRFWAQVAGWYGRGSGGRRGAARGRQARRPELEPCEGRVLLGQVVSIAQARGREILVGAELRGLVTVTPQSPTVFRVTSTGSGRGTVPLRRITSVETSDVSTLTSPTTLDIAQGMITLTTANGARLTGTYTGNDDIVQSQQVFLGQFNITITGGTGRFRGATGSLTGRNVFNNGPPTPTLPANGFTLLLFGSLNLRRARG